MASNTRVSQAPAETIVSPTDADARVSQAPAETILLPTDAETRVSQVPVEVLMEVVIDTARVFGTIIG